MYCGKCKKLTTEIKGKMGVRGTSDTSDAFKVQLSYCTKCNLVYAE